jgi:hypothetical protein
MKNSEDNVGTFEKILYKIFETIGSEIGTLLGAFVVGILLNGLSVYTIAAIFGGGVTGAICGLLPYFTGRRKNKKLSKISIWVCTAAGIILGIILALPVALFFTIVIANSKAPE